MHRRLKSRLSSRWFAKGAQLLALLHAVGAELLPIEAILRLRAAGSAELLTLECRFCACCTRICSRFEPRLCACYDPHLLAVKAAILRLLADLLRLDIVVLCLPLHSELLTLEAAVLR